MLFANSFSQKNTQSINTFVNQSISLEKTYLIKGGEGASIFTTWDTTEIS